MLVSVYGTCAVGLGLALEVVTLYGSAKFRVIS